jgi:hypothetical protein
VTRDRFPERTEGHKPQTRDDLARRSLFILARVVIAYQLEPGPGCRALGAMFGVLGEVTDGLLRESLSESIVLTHPMGTRRGLADVAEHLQGFQQRSPGGSFRMNEMLGWERHGIATWQLVDAQGQAGFWGYDVVAYDDQGRIESILLFSHIEKQMLK